MGTLKEYENKPSLAGIAIALGLESKQRLYNLAKQPIPGEPYDPKVINWDAVEKFINRKLEGAGETGIVVEDGTIHKTLQDVTDYAFLWDSEHPEGTRAVRGRGGSSATNKKMIDLGNGKSCVERKYKQWNWGQGEDAPKMCFRKDPKIYEVVYQTISHTVLRPVDLVNGGYVWLDESVKVCSNSVMNIQAVSPSALQDSIDRRFKERGWEKPDPDEEPTSASVEAQDN